MGADRRLVGLKRIHLVHGLCANLERIHFSTKALSEAGMKMEMKGKKVFKATLDGRVLWDLRGGKDMHRSMWEIPVLPWKEAAARLAAEVVRGGHASHITSGGGGDGSDGGLLVHGGGALPSVNLSMGEMDWLTAHRRFGHVALPLLQQLFKEERVKGLRIQGELKRVMLLGSSLKSGKRVKAERKSGKRVKAIRSDCGGEFLGAEFRSWLRRHGIKQLLTTPLAIRHATVIKKRVLTHVGGQHLFPMEKWSGKKPLVDMLRGSKGWLMWDPKSNTIFTTRDAKFMEGLMLKEWSERGRRKFTILLVIEVGTNDTFLIPIELSSSSELTEVSHDLGGAEGEAADVEGVLQQGEAHVAERRKRDAVRGGAKEGAAKERPKRAAHPRDFLKYERLGGPKVFLVQEEEAVPSGSGGVRGAGEARRGVAGGPTPIASVSTPAKDDVKAFNLEKFFGEDWASWSFRMELLFNHYGLLEVMDGELKRPASKGATKEWDRRSKDGFFLLSRCLSSNQLHHVKHLMKDIHCGSKAWKILKDVHAPSSEAMVVVLERQLHAVKINAGDAVQGVFDQLRDLSVKLSAAGVDYPNKIKCCKALSLLPKSWGLLVVNLNGMKDSWSLEWICAQVLQEEFRRKELTAAAGEGGGSAYGMKGFKGRGSKKGKAKEGSGGEQNSGGKRSNKGGK
ncbi:unnamed protein product [Closterium sp. NIES-53]